METIIRHSPITRNRPIFSTYGNILFPVAVYRTFCVEGIKSQSTVRHADPKLGGTKGFCLPPLAASHENLSFATCTPKKKGLPIVLPRILKIYGRGLAQLVININFLGSRVEGLPLFTRP